MAKVKKISDNEYLYNCECGKSILLESDEKVEKLSKCFECQNKIELLYPGLELFKKEPSV